MAIAHSVGSDEVAPLSIWPYLCASDEPAELEISLGPVYWALTFRSNINLAPQIGWSMPYPVGPYLNPPWVHKFQARFLIRPKF